MSKLIYLTFPQAKYAVEVESGEDIIGFSRVMQLGYGYKAEDVEIDGAYNDDVAEIIRGHLCADNPMYGDSLEFYIELSLPGSDLWFDANGDDIMYARILLNNGYGVTWTPENTQFRVKNPEVQAIVDELAPLAAKNWKNFIWSAWHACWNYEAGYDTLDDVRKELIGWTK